MPPQIATDQAPRGAPKTFNTFDDTLVLPTVRLETKSKPIVKITGNTTEEIETEIKNSSPQAIAILAEFKKDKVRYDLILQHIKNITDIFEGHNISHEDFGNKNKDASPYILLLNAFKSLNNSLDIKTSDKINSELPNILKINEEMLKKIVAQDKTILLSNFGLIPNKFIADVIFYEKDPIESLEKKITEGYFTRLKDYVDSIDKMETRFSPVHFIFFDRLHRIKETDVSFDNNAKIQIFKTSNQLESICPTLGEIYLNCLSSLNVKTSKELLEQSDLLLLYISGLIENKEPSPGIGLDSIARLEGALLLDQDLVQNLLLINKHTGFLQVSRIKPEEYKESAKHIKQVIKQTSDYIKSPELFKERRVAVTIFSGTDSILDSLEINTGKFLKQFTDEGHILLPYEVHRDSDIYTACVSAKSISGSHPPILIILGHGTEHKEEKKINGEKKKIDVTDGEGISLGDTWEEKWFLKVNQKQFEEDLRLAKLPKVEAENYHNLNPWIKLSTVNSKLTFDTSILDITDSKEIGELKSAIDPKSTQIILYGCGTGRGDFNIARLISETTGAEVFGSDDFVTSAFIEFGPDKKVQGLEFKGDFPNFDVIKTKHYQKAGPD